MEFILLPLIGFISAILTGIVGMGGGAILIAVLLMFMAPAQAIPFHGTVQIFGNLTRVYLLHSHICWPIVLRFAAFIAPGAAAGMWVFQGLSDRTILVLIGLVILATLFSREVRFLKGREFPLWLFYPLGFVVGFMAVNVGVTAIFTGAFMVRKELSKEAINATMAMFSAMGHLCKIVAFGIVGFDFISLLPLFALMVPAVILGTAVGKYLLGRFSEEVFLRLFKLALGGLALKLVLWEGVVMSLM